MTSTPVKMVLAASATVAFAFGVAACGGSDTAEVAPDASISIPGTDTGAVEVSGSLPAGWPSDVPTPNGFTPGGGAGVSSEGEKIYSAGFKGTTPLEQAVKDYGVQLEGEGWKESDESSALGGAISRWVKGERFVQVLGVVEDAEGQSTTVLNVTASSTS